jgi:putative FmdB family regulatory protein
MPLYDLICPKCDQESEHLLGMDDQWLHVKCPSCGEKMTRGSNKKYHGMRVLIQGDTVAGGCNYDYFDENLGCHIKNKQHRAEVMKQQGVREYSPDPVMQKHRDERKHIRKNSKPGDIDAAKAIHKEKKAAQTKRQQAAVDRAFDNAPLPTLNLGD